MRLFDRRRLPAEVAADVRSHNTQRVLSWAHGFDDNDERWVVGFSDQMLVGRAGDWQGFGWHQIARGGWDKDADRLRWTSYAGGRHAVVLDDPGNFPELFRERINASIVLQQHVPVPNDPGDGLMIAARRRLGNGSDANQIDWHVTLAKGTTWQTPGARETGEVILARLQNEYERG